MHGYTRLSQCSLSSTTSTTPPSSPPSSPRLRYSRNRKPSHCTQPATTTTTVTVTVTTTSSKLNSITERLMYIALSAVFRRRGVLLFAPLLYISGMLMYMGTLTLDGSHQTPPLPGSIYRSPQVFEKLWPYMQLEDNQTSSNSLMAAWHPKLRQRWEPNIMQGTSLTGSQETNRSNGFLIVEANGGLNQQRISICDAVAVAGLLNATLVIPQFHFNSVWRDSSKFGDIFDEDFFIHVLENNVKVIKELPEDILQQYDHNISNIVNLRVKAWSSPAYYLQKVRPKLLQLGAVRIAPFSNRLAHAVPSNIQGLRCLANYEALRFSQPIRTLAESMVERMVRNSSMSGGKYISVHLRFEEDMVAFSCCIYDGGEEEKREMDIVREKGWKGKFRKSGRVIRPDANRMDGKCPLTPLEVGMMLRGMGFDNNTSVYLAAGKIYKAEKYMAPLRQLFPLLQTKETLASEAELAPFQGHSSRMAALDYTVCLHSEVFVTTQGGNFPHFLTGERRYFNGGHAKTIKPDKRKLALLFDSPDIRWESFKRQMREMLHHSELKGNELRKPGTSLYSFPMPDCMCKVEERQEERREERHIIDDNATAII